MGLGLALEMWKAMVHEPPYGHCLTTPRISTPLFVATTKPWFQPWCQAKETRKGSKTTHPFTSHFTTRGEDHEPWEGSWGCLEHGMRSQVEDATDSNTNCTTMTRGILDGSSTKA